MASSKRTLSTVSAQCIADACPVELWELNADMESDMYTKWCENLFINSKYRVPRKYLFKCIHFDKRRIAPLIQHLTLDCVRCSPFNGWRTPTAHTASSTRTPVNMCSVTCGEVRTSCINKNVDEYLVLPKRVTHSTSSAGTCG